MCIFIFQTFKICCFQKSIYSTTDILEPLDVQKIEVELSFVTQYF